MITVNYFWTAKQQRAQALEALRAEAQVIAAQFMALRQFIATSQDQINYDSHGNFEFKHLNPAAVGKGVADLFHQASVYNIKQTRINPRNGENQPDSFERQVLARFQQNPRLNEVFAPDTLDGRPVYRYLLPMYTEDSCLQCHGEPRGQLDISGYPREGLALGELAGALSITVPAERFYAALWTQKVGYLTFTGILSIVTIIVSYLLLNKLVVNPLANLSMAATRMGQGDLAVEPEAVWSVGEIQTLATEFGIMASRLRNFYAELEYRVNQRTAALQDANVQLAEANRLQREFLANMTHEIRTPLTSIIAFTELLADEVPGSINSEQRQALQDIQESAEQLLNLINDLLDLTLIEAGQMKLSVEPVDMVDLLQSCARAMQPVAQKAGLSFSLQIPTELPLVKVDPNRLRQVLLNLLSNALKFTPAGGAVCLGAEQQGDQVAVWVADTGIGISLEDQEIIFEKFRQVDGSATRHFRGAGLGLALSYSLVQMHGGVIQVESQLGWGSIFTVILPLNRGEK